MQGELRKKKKELQIELSTLEELEEISTLSRGQIMRKQWVICENLKLLEQEEVCWLQRSHETWLLKGDSNTEYFHKCANGRKRKNLVISLEKDGELMYFRYLSLSILFIQTHVFQYNFSSCIFQILAICMATGKIATTPQYILHQ